MKTPLLKQAGRLIKELLRLSLDNPHESTGELHDVMLKHAEAVPEDYSKAAEMLEHLQELEHQAVVSVAVRDVASLSEGEKLFRKIASRFR